MTNQCPCCGRQVPLITDRGVFESHVRSDGKIHGNLRSGAYCESSGYTPDKARRWSALSVDQKRTRIKSPEQEAR